jgi:hypothetical protein
MSHLLLQPRRLQNIEWTGWRRDTDDDTDDAENVVVSECRICNCFSRGVSLFSWSNNNRTCSQPPPQRGPPLPQNYLSSDAVVETHKRHKTHYEHSYAHHMLFIFFWHPMFCHHVSIKCRETTRGCHQMPFLIMLSCQKNRNLTAEKTTTSELKVLMACCILHKWRCQFTRDSIYVNNPETGIALFFQ